MSPPSSVAYDEAKHCPSPSKWPDTKCSPPELYTPSGGAPVQVECFRRQGCYDPSVDYDARMAAFDRPVYGASNKKAPAAGGQFIAAGSSYSGDAVKQLHAAQSLCVFSFSIFLFSPIRSTSV